MNPLVLAAIPLYAALLPAQTFVVDAANGPGTQYTSLAAAVAGVPDGSTLLVRAGAYDGNLTIAGKGLTILGQPGARIAVPSNGVLQVQGLAAHQAFVLRGLAVDLQSVLGDYLVDCQANQGLVVLEGLGAHLGYSTLRLQAVACAGVVVRNSGFRGAVTAIDSTAVFERCDIFSSFFFATSHLTQVRGHLQLVDCHVLGANVGTPIEQSACLLDGGELRVLGTTQIDGGQQLTSFTGHAIAGTGKVRLSPQAVLHGCQPPIEATVRWSTVEMPRTDVTAAPLGSPVTASMTGPTGALGVLLVGWPGPAVNSPVVIDPLWWQPGSAVTVAVGAIGPTTAVSCTVPLPAPPAWRGLQLLWQGVSLAPSGRLMASNPAWSIAF